MLRLLHAYQVATSFIKERKTDPKAVVAVPFWGIACCLSAAQRQVWQAGVGCSVTQRQIASRNRCQIGLNAPLVFYRIRRFCPPRRHEVNAAGSGNGIGCEMPTMRPNASVPFRSIGSITPLSK